MPMSHYFCSELRSKEQTEAARKMFLVLMLTTLFVASFPLPTPQGFRPGGAWQSIKRSKQHRLLSGQQLAVDLTIGIGYRLLRVQLIHEIDLMYGACEIILRLPIQQQYGPVVFDNVQSATNEPFTSSASVLEKNKNPDSYALLHAFIDRCFNFANATVKS